MFRSSTSTFDRLLDKATSNLLLEPDWMSIMAICDSIRGGDTPPKYAVSAIKKKFYHENPHVQLFALQVSVPTRDRADFPGLLARFLFFPVSLKI